VVGNNTPVFFFRDPLRFPDLNHAIKRDPRTGMRSADNNWDFWTLLPEALHQVTIVMSERAFRRASSHAWLRQPYVQLPQRRQTSASGSNSTFVPSRVFRT